jgi:Enoyl-CoA hydratase/carnithine racemase
MTHEPVLTEIDRVGTATLTLNRPDIHNAFDDALVAELTVTLRCIEKDRAVRAVVLAAKGESFSAGADLNWMRRMAEASETENIEDALRLAELMRILNGLSKPTLAVVQGAAFGGGVGLVACCDIAIAAEEASFCLSEVRLGLIPAVISPYVVAAMGARAARRYFLSGEPFDVNEAHRLGLVHEVAPRLQLQVRAAAILKSLRQGGPSAQAAAKELIASVSQAPLDDEQVADTACRIAYIRASQEGREGVSAFLEKRKPIWTA